MMIQTSLLAYGLVILAFHGSRASASVVPPSVMGDDDPPCTGLSLDFSRLIDITRDDINTAAEGAAMFQDRSYGVNTVTTVVNPSTSQCVKQRHRLKQLKEGVPIFGAETIVTVDACDPPDEAAFGGGYERTPLSGVDPRFISNFEGKSYSNIEETAGYVPSVTEGEATSALARFFETTADKVGDLEMVIFPSYEQGDFLSYTTEVWVSKENDIELYDVFISAHNLDILNVCRKTNKAGLNRRRLRSRTEKENAEEEQAKGRELQDTCRSCANQAKVSWTQEKKSCPINSLYLNDEGRDATCVVGDLNGETVLGPGPVPELKYGGTFDCNGRESGCKPNIIPTSCSDAISDVHYGVVATMQFYQDYLGVMGGLRVNANDPIHTASHVHFGNQFCNAFFTPQTNSLYFGDCNCEFWTPLVSIDVASHEYTHGVTAYSSGLVYAFQPGGLNEGYSDIMGATMEFFINDNKDVPDFNLGENLNRDGNLEGFILRYMEDPPSDGKSIANVCDFKNNLGVHFSSGVLNKAFTSAVRSCQSASCSDGNERDCVLLLGPLFMYTNIHKLTRLSGYLDAAANTCGVINEFYAAMQPKETSCLEGDAKKFVIEGWAAAGVTIREETCGARTTSGCVLPTTPANAGGVPMPCLSRIGSAFRSAVSWVFSPFN